MNSFTQSLQDSMFIAALFIAALFIICTVSLALRNYEAKCQIKKLKKWRKFAEIEKKQRHEEYDTIKSELAEERAFNDTQGSMHVRLMLKYAHVQEESEKAKKELKSSKEEIVELSNAKYKLACEKTDLRDELKIAQTCLKVAETEISDLKSKLTRPTKRNEKGQFTKSEPEAIQRIGRTERTEPERDWTQSSKDELLAEAKRRGFTRYFVNDCDELWTEPNGLGGNKVYTRRDGWQE